MSCIIFLPLDCFSFVPSWRLVVLCSCWDFWRNQQGKFEALLGVIYRLRRSREKEKYNNRWDQNRLYVTLNTYWANHQLWCWNLFLFFYLFSSPMSLGDAFIHSHKYLREKWVFYNHNKSHYNSYNLNQIMIKYKGNEILIISMQILRCVHDKAVK